MVKRIIKSTLIGRMKVERPRCRWMGEQLGDIKILKITSRWMVTSNGEAKRENLKRGPTRSVRPDMMFVCLKASKCYYNRSEMKCITIKT